jgi:transcriptional regulator with XRE-family HTH domain
MHEDERTHLVSGHAVVAQIAARTKIVRRSKNMNQTNFAKRLGVSLRGYRNYEHGDREMPAGVLRSLYLEFKVDLVWMLCGGEFGK